MKDIALMRSSLRLLKRQKEAGSTQEEAKKGCQSKAGKHHSS